MKYNGFETLTMSNHMTKSEKLEYLDPNCGNVYFYFCPNNVVLTSRHTNFFQLGQNHYFWSKLLNSVTCFLCLWMKSNILVFD